jgi:predicted flap endonuclease-1-like 5' DNA nuclease
MSTSAITIPFPALSETSRSGRVKQMNESHRPAEIKKLAEPIDESSRTPDRPSDDRDNLQRIKGIGQSIAQALNSLGIHRYADLANFTPDSLADLLKARIPSISPRRIERDDWLGQAMVLAQHRNTEHTPPAEEMRTAKAPEEVPNPFPWRQHAGFSVFFDSLRDEHGNEVWQTRVYHDESGKETLLSGIETAAWVNWILERAKLPAAAGPTPTEVAALPVHVTPYDARIEILDVRDSEVRPSSGVPEKRLMAKVRFQVSGAEAETLTADCLPFRVEVHTVNLKSRASDLVASEGGQLRPQVFEYTSQQAFPFPELGRYELHTIVLVLPPGEMMAYHLGPTIKVVP